jgi:hypothetical protein
VRPSSQPQCLALTYVTELPSGEGGQIGHLLLQHKSGFGWTTEGRPLPFDTLRDLLASLPYALKLRPVPAAGERDCDHCVERSTDCACSSAGDCTGSVRCVGSTASRVGATASARLVCVIDVTRSRAAQMALAAQQQALLNEQRRMEEEREASARRGVMAAALSPVPSASEREYLEPTDAPFGDEFAQSVRANRAITNNNNAAFASTVGVSVTTRAAPQQQQQQQQQQNSPMQPQQPQPQSPMQAPGTLMPPQRSDGSQLPTLAAVDDASPGSRRAQLKRVRAVKGLSTQVTQLKSGGAELTLYGANGR